MVKILKFATVIEANFKIAGGIVGGTPTNVPFENLVGTTLTFSNPAGSWTFTVGTGQPGQLRFSEVKTQLEANIANLVVETVDNKVGFRHATDGQSAAMAAVDEVARSILGFSNPVGGEAITGLFLNPPDGPAPRYHEFVSEYGAVYVSYSDIGATNPLITFGFVQAALAAATSAVDVNGQQLTNVADPTTPQGVVTRAFLSALVGNLVAAIVPVSVDVDLTATAITTIDTRPLAPAGPGRWKLLDIDARVKAALVGIGASSTVRIGSTSGGQEIVKDQIILPATAVGTIAGGLVVATLGTDLPAANNYKAAYPAGQGIFVDVTAAGAPSAGTLTVYLLWQALG